MLKLPVAILGACQSVGRGPPSACPADAAPRRPLVHITYICAKWHDPGQGLHAIACGSPGPGEKYGLMPGADGHEAGELGEASRPVGPEVAFDPPGLDLGEELAHFPAGRLTHGEHILPRHRQDRPLPRLSVAEPGAKPRRGLLRPLRRPFRPRDEHQVADNERTQPIEHNPPAPPPPPPPHPLPPP